MTEPRRFPPPSTIEDIDAAFVVADGSGQKLAYVYYEEEPGLTGMASCPPPKRIFVIVVTVLIAISGLYGDALEGFPMNTLLTGIAFAIGMVLATQAFAAYATDGTDCPHVVLQNGHYICDIDN